MVFSRNLIYFALVWIEFGSSEFCRYDLTMDICVQHLSKNQSKSCDSLRSELDVDLGQEAAMSVLTSLLQWRGEEVDQLEFRATLQGEEVQYATKGYTPSEFHKDLMRGLVRTFLLESWPDTPDSCRVQRSSVGKEEEIENRFCRRTSSKDAIYHIEEFIAERRTQKEGEKIASLEVTETFSHFSNLNEKIGEQVTSTLRLSRGSCRAGRLHPPSEYSTVISTEPVKQERADPSGPTIDQILQEQNVLKLISSLRKQLVSMPESELVNLLRKYKSNKKFEFVLEAFGSIGSSATFKAVLQVFNSRTKQLGPLERYLIALSFNPNLDPEILPELRSIVKQYKNSPNIVETAFYCTCKQLAKTKQSAQSIEELLKLVGGLGCSDSVCQRRMLLCISALGTDMFTENIMKILKSSKDKKVRETAASVLAASDLVHPKLKLQMEDDVWKIILNNKLKNEEMAKLLELVDLGSVNSTLVNQLLQTKDLERKAYLANKLTSSNPRLKTDYSIGSYALQGQSVYISNPLELEGGAEGGFTFATSMSGGALSRTSFALTLRDINHDRKQLISIQSFIGGISGMLGEADPEDDPEANASIQISLLGLPLRPLVLFSSVGDLIEMYWSGAGQEKTTLLQGSVPLEDREAEWESFLGVRVKVASYLALHIHSQGEGSVSIWESSGTGSLHTGVSVRGLSRVGVLAPGASFLSTSLQLNTGIQSDTKVQMGTALQACVIMSSDNLLLDLHMEGRDINLTETLSLGGMTWNINKKNNDICTIFYK